MPANRISYIRSRRRRAGLTQTDVATLVAVHGKGTVSRYERAGRLPSLETALAYEAVFGIPVAELFASTFQSIRSAVVERARKLEEKLRHGGTGAVFARRKRSIEIIAT